MTVIINQFKIKICFSVNSKVINDIQYFFEKYKRHTLMLNDKIVTCKNIKRNEWI